MFRALSCPSSGARNFDADYHIGLFVLGFAVGWRLGAVRLEWCPGCSPDTTRELLVMGIVMPETC